ncbi:MAG: hypothetical protein ACJ8BF_00340 [Gemmatimonadales bacterium]
MRLSPATWGRVPAERALWVAALASLACHAGSTPSPEPARCSPDVPPNAEHPISRRTSMLAGDYELIQVRTQPTHGVSSGRLHLALLDSTARAGALGGATRDLTGWLDPLSGDHSSHPDANSHDPRFPGAVLAGNHLLLGRSRGVDSHVEELTITAVAVEGFWGWWKAERGWEMTVETKTNRVLPDPAGYFCALRVTKER